MADSPPPLWSPAWALVTDVASFMRDLEPEHYEFRAEVRDGELKRPGNRSIGGDHFFAITKLRAWAVVPEQGRGTPWGAKVAFNVVNRTKASSGIWTDAMSMRALVDPEGNPLLDYELDALFTIGPQSDLEVEWSLNAGELAEGEWHFGVNVFGALVDKRLMERFDQERRR